MSASLLQTASSKVLDIRIALTGLVGHASSHRPQNMHRPASMWNLVSSRCLVPAIFFPSMLMIWTGQTLAHAPQTMHTSGCRPGMPR